MKSATLPAPLLALASATSLYRVEVAGNALAPRYRDGDFAIIAPAVDASPESIEAGSIVLVALSIPGMEGGYQKTALYRINADGDLLAGKTIIPSGQYILLGIAQD